MPGSNIFTSHMSTVTVKILPLYFFLPKFLRVCSYTKIHISYSFPIGLIGRPKTNVVFFNNSVSSSHLFAQPWNIANQFRFSVVPAEFMSTVYVGVSLSKLKKLT